MAIAELLAELERDAEAERAALLAAADAEAEALVAAAAEAGHGRGRAALAAFTAVRRADADVEIARVATRARRAVLGARAALLTRLEAAVHAALAPAVAAAAERLAPVLVDAVVAAAGDGAAIVRCAPALIGPVQARVAARRCAKLSVGVGPEVATGVIAALDGGRVVIDASLATRLGLDWGRLAPAAVAAALAIGRAVRDGHDGGDADLGARVAAGGRA